MKLWKLINEVNSQMKKYKVCEIAYKRRHTDNIRKWMPLKNTQIKRFHCRL